MSIPTFSILETFFSLLCQNIDIKIISYFRFRNPKSMQNEQRGMLRQVQKQQWRSRMFMYRG